MRGLRERPAWSPSALELWARCPVKWFVERYLDVRALEPDSEPLRRGSVAHETLERTLGALREQTGSAQVHPQTVGRARALAHEVLREVAARIPISPNPERLAAGVRRLEADLDRYLDAAAWLGPLAVATAGYSLATVYLYHFLSLGRSRFAVVLVGLLVCQAAAFAALHGSPRELIGVQIVTAFATLAVSEVWHRVSHR